MLLMIFIFNMQELVRFFLLRSEVRRGFCILYRVIDESHVLIFSFHVRCSFVVALMRLIFHMIASCAELSSAV